MQPCNNFICVCVLCWINNLISNQQSSSNSEFEDLNEQEDNDSIELEHQHQHQNQQEIYQIIEKEGSHTTAQSIISSNMDNTDFHQRSINGDSPNIDHLLDMASSSASSVSSSMSSPLGSNQLHDIKTNLIECFSTENNINNNGFVCLYF